jgi:hypothetical protein
MIAVSAAVRLPARTFLRASWNRVLTHHDRDADVVLIGLGYRFDGVAPKQPVLL